MPKQTGDVVGSGSKGKGRVIDRVTKTLDRPVEFRSSRINEEEVVETLRDQSPTANQRVAQDQGGVVPDKTVARSRGIDNEDGDQEN